MQVVTNGHAAAKDPPPPPPNEDYPPPPPSDDYPPPPPPVNVTTAPAPPPPPPPSVGDAAPPPPPASSSKKVQVAPKKDPLSIEEILRKKQEADAAAAKPKFLSRAERERLALEKRQKEVEGLKKRAVSDREKGQNGYNGVSARQSNSDVPMTNGYNEHESAVPKGPRALRKGEIPTGPAAMRAQNARGNDAPTAPAPRQESGRQDPGQRGEKRTSQEDTAAALIRQRYMGAEMNTSSFSAKKKRKRTTEKRFVFDWNNDEDTAQQDYNPIYQAPTEATFFGRGRLGGFADDPKGDSVKKYAQALQQRDSEAGSQRAAEIVEMERRRREDGGRNGLDHHWSEKPLALMRERDWRIFKEDFNIATRGGHIPNPMRSWKESGLPKNLLDIVESVGYTEPSPIQRAAIPIALQSRDLIGVAVTGSGKTAAYLLPLIVYISELPPPETPRVASPLAIILCPTRELALQIEVEATKFAKPLGFNTVAVVGGHSVEEQSHNLSGQVDILVATVGRLVDNLERRVLVLEQCCYVIMDEADRMVDMGFEEGVNKILDHLPVGTEKPDSEEAEDANLMSQHLIQARANNRAIQRYRQTMMYTATMPVAVERIARKYLRRPATVNIGLSGEAVDTVEQRVEFIAGEDRRKKRLYELLGDRQNFPPPVIVFCNIKNVSSTLQRDISRQGFNAVLLHGGKTQKEREAAIAALRSGSADILVATDVAARGLDIPDVSLVIQFDMATSIEQYTHRIGRTGRAGKAGCAVTFIGEENKDTFYDLKHMLSKSSLSRVPEELKKHEASMQKPGPKGSGASKAGKGGDLDSGGFGGKGSSGGW